MIINMTDNLRLDVELPMLNCESFEVVWKPQHHAHLKLEGYVEANITWNWSRLYESQIKIWIEDGASEQIIFHGRLLNIVKTVQAGMEKVCITGVSASILLDQKKRSRSFQDVKTSFYEIISQVSQREGGQVICTADKTKVIDKPVIQYEETDWEFCKRLASHLNIPVIPDVESGNPCFWVGMRKGEAVPSFSEAWYLAEVDKTGIKYWVKDLINYKLGDRTTFLEQEMIICEKRVEYQNGQVQFYYLLEEGKTNTVKVGYQEQFAGISLSGVVQSIKEETVNIVLDIDNGADTGEYFYEWLPDTGNVLYAVPEPGAPVSLYFGSQDEREGIVIHCIHKKQNKAHEKSDYKNRILDIAGDQCMNLFDSTVSLSKSGNHNVLLENSLIAARTSQNLEIIAEETIKFKANTITVDSPDEIGIYQG
ncbi:contractile injection system protein, VgrG/Pvc8 family [Lacrimispora brassicae]